MPRYAYGGRLGDFGIVDLIYVATFLAVPFYVTCVLVVLLPLLRVVVTFRCSTTLPVPVGTFPVYGATVATRYLTFIPDLLRLIYDSPLLPFVCSHTPRVPV